MVKLRVTDLTVNMMIKVQLNGIITERINVQNGLK